MFVLYKSVTPCYIIMTSPENETFCLNEITSINKGYKKTADQHIKQAGKDLCWQK